MFQIVFWTKSEWFKLREDLFKTKIHSYAGFAVRFGDLQHVVLPKMLKDIDESDGSNLQNILCQYSCCNHVLYRCLSKDGQTVLGYAIKQNNTDAFQRILDLVYDSDDWFLYGDRTMSHLHRLLRGSNRLLETAFLYTGLDRILVEQPEPHVDRNGDHYMELIPQKWETIYSYLLPETLNTLGVRNLGESNQIQATKNP